MEKVNSKLYMENYEMMQENTRLRKAAELLDQENRSLLNQLKHKLLQGPSHHLNPASHSNPKTEPASKSHNNV